MILLEFVMRIFLLFFFDFVIFRLLLINICFIVLVVMVNDWLMEGFVYFGDVIDIVIVLVLYVVINIFRL